MRMEERIERLERRVTMLLRIGVAFSVVAMAGGLCLSALNHPKALFSSSELARLVAPGAAFPHAYRDLWRGVFTLHGQAIATLGIVILLTLPPVRVFCAGLLFLYQKDRVYIMVTVGVLSLLMLSLFLGKFG